MMALVSVATCSEGRALRCAVSCLGVAEYCGWICSLQVHHVTVCSRLLKFIAVPAIHVILVGAISCTPLIIESPVEELVWERQSRTGYVLRMRKRDENERKC